MAFIFTDFFSFITIFVAVVVIAVIWILYKSTVSPAGFPPGPRPVPIFGNLLMIRKNNVLHRHITFDKLSKVYGPVFSLRMGSIPAVVLSDLEVMEEALVQKAECFTRPRLLPVLLHRSLKHGQPLSLWKPWKDGPLPLRKLTKDYLLTTGKLRGNVEQKIQEEVEVFCSELSKQTNKPTSLKQLNKTAIADVLYSNIFGSRLDHNDQKCTNFVTGIDTYTDEKTLGSMVNFFPLLQYLPAGKRLFERITKNLNILDKFMDGEIMEHKKQFNPDLHNDLIDYYLHTQDLSIEKDDFQRYALDLHVGTFGVFATLNWLWFLMARYPQIQTKCQEEIDNHCQGMSKDRNLKLSDQEELPYVRATILETLRWVTPVPLTVPYETVNDVSIGGYQIPKNTLIMVNLYSVHRNHKNWDNPGHFNPGRWLTDDGKLDDGLLKRGPGFVPYGVGRRDCVGKALAEGEMFLFFATVMRKFEIELSDPDNPPSLGGDLRLTMQTKPHKVIIIPRSN